MQQNRRYVAVALVLVAPFAFATCQPGTINLETDGGNLVGDTSSSSDSLGESSDRDTVDTVTVDTAESDPVDTADTEQLDSDEVCVDGSYPVGLIPLDMLVAIDTSYSMDYSPVGEVLNKWESVKAALKAFSADVSSTGLGMGIQYFPLRKICSVPAYKTPAVEILSLPDKTQAISASLDAQRMAGGTPMVPLLEGSLAYAQGWSAAHPERSTIIVLATDGVPDDTCQFSTEGSLPNNVENVALLAKQGAENSPRVPTFVIGVGSELGALNAISQAGSGSDAFLVNVENGNVQQQFEAALQEIRLRSTCNFDIEKAAADKDIDPERVNVTFTMSGEKEKFVNVGDKEGCSVAPQKGWYYDNPDKPREIILCPLTCSSVQSRPSGTLSIVFGCKTDIV